MVTGSDIWKLGRKEGRKETYSANNVTNKTKYGIN
jgi:hypothetical protein